MNKPIIYLKIIIILVGAALEFLAAAVIHFRLLPLLQADTINWGRGGPMPTEQFVAYAVPILVTLGCFSILLAVVLVILDKRKAS